MPDRDPTCSKCAELSVALDNIRTGGNHLASVLINRLGCGSKFPAFGTPHDEAQEAIGDSEMYDVWCCWNAIMLNRKGVGILAAHDAGKSAELLECVRQAIQKRLHIGDPCVVCGATLEEMAIGPCPGNSQHDAEVRRQALAELLATASITVPGGMPLDYRASLEEAEAWLRHHDAEVRKPLEERVAVLESSQRNTAAFLRRWLNSLQPKQSCDERGHVVNTWAAAEIPDWELRQKLAEIEGAE